MAIENSLDLLLCLLYAKGGSRKTGEKIKGMTRLQKLFFLLWKEAGFDKYVSSLKEFEAYNYGPFSNSLYDDIEFAEEIGLIKVEYSEPEYNLENIDEEEFLESFAASEGIEVDANPARKDFQLTDLGEKEAKDIWGSLEPETKKKIISIKTRYNSKPFMELMRYVYKKYPEYAKKSIMVL